MKFLKILTAAIVILSATTLVGLSTPADAGEIDIKRALKESTDVDERCKELCLGNSCTGSIVTGKFSWSKKAKDGIIYLKCRLHNKQQHCASKPWPMSGEICYDVYNYWVNIKIKAFLQNCRVGAVIGTSTNLIYALPAAFTTLFVNSPAFKLAIIDKNVIPGCRR